MNKPISSPRLLLSCFGCLFFFLYCNNIFLDHPLYPCNNFVLNQDSPDAIRIILVAISIFGPRKVTRELTSSDLGAEQFLKSFNEIIVPWCLKKFSPSIAARLDLLLALLDGECFSEQWDSIVKYLVNREEVSLDAGTMGKNHISVLAVLMEKVRERTGMTVQQFGLCQNNWHHELLDLVALDVVQASSPSGNSEAQFLWYADETLSKIFSVCIVFASSCSFLESGVHLVHALLLSISQSNC